MLLFTAFASALSDPLKHLSQADKRAKAMESFGIKLVSNQLFLFNQVTFIVVIILFW